MDSQFDYKTLFTINYGNRSLQLTREGGGFIILVFGVGIGAINTGNNLLYLILAMCCSFIAVSGALSEITLRGISITGGLNPRLYGGQPYPLTLRVKNGKRKFPSFSLHLSLPRNPPGRYEVAHGVYLFHLSAGREAEKTLLLKALRRGPLSINTCRITTSFPFGFFVKTRTVPLDVRTLVFPLIHDVNLPSPATASLEGEGVLKTRGEEVYAVREFRAGDPLSAVHWKSTARTGAMRVKEFRSGGHQRYTIVLNVLDPRTGRPVDSEIVEQRVGEAASLAYHLIRRGDEVSLKTADHQTGFDNSEAHLDDLLTHLAWVGWKPGSAGEFSDSPGPTGVRRPTAG